MDASGGRHALLTSVRSLKDVAGSRGEEWGQGVYPASLRACGLALNKGSPPGASPPALSRFRWRARGLSGQFPYTLPPARDPPPLPDLRTIRFLRGLISPLTHMVSRDLAIVQSLPREA